MVKILKCERCLNEWAQRFAREPKVCPKCNSPYWNKPRQRPATVQAIPKEME